MSDSLVARLRQLAKRAGLSEVPPVALIAAVCVGACALAWAAWHWWPRSAPSEVVFEPSPATASGARSVAPSVSASEPPSAVVVHVVGCVRRPGVYELPDGSRVVDAVDAAGGALPDAVVAGVNMARPVSDGEQILVPSEDDPPGAAAPGEAVPSNQAAAGVSGPVNINTADAAQLDTLPGVGPSTAEKIIAERTANGPFASVEDLGRVSGIGPKKLEQLKDLVSVR